MPRFTKEELAEMEFEDMPAFADDNPKAQQSAAIAERRAQGLTWEGVDTGLFLYARAARETVGHSNANPAQSSTNADMGSADDYLRAMLEAAEDGEEVDWGGVYKAVSEGW